MVKVGSSTVTRDGGIDAAVVADVSRQIAELVALGNRAVVVTSGAITCGWSVLGDGKPRPDDPSVLQAVSAVGQHHLMRAWADGLGAHGLVAGQVLLAPLDFGHRRQYLHARRTIGHLWELGSIPVVNENDAVTDEEIRFGDNDRLAALVAHLVGADTLVLLTDTAGLLSSDPRLRAGGTLIEEVAEVDAEVMQMAGGPGAIGSGGMASKLAAARIASWSGVTTVIADGRRPGVVAGALSHERGIGTICMPRAERLAARKLWIAFALTPAGTLVVDAGAREALVAHGGSLLVAGVLACRGRFVPDDAVEIVGEDGRMFAKGLTRLRSSRSPEWKGKRAEDLPADLSPVAVHRDDMVVLE